MTNPGHIGQNRGSPPLPDEIAFLLRFGVDARVLRDASASARLTGISADRALLSEGHLSAQLFYACLARHLGVPYMRGPLPVCKSIGLERASEVESVPLAANAAGLEFALAPRGETLATLLRRFAADGSVGEARVTVTTPQRLSALVRLGHRGALVRYASLALPEWNASLSAHAGWRTGQILFGLAGGASLARAAWVAPGDTLVAVSLVFSVMFMAMVLVRLAATASSFEAKPQPVRRTPDAALPTYTVVAPLYREGRVVPRLVAALSGLDYPVLGSKLTKAKLLRSLAICNDEVWPSLMSSALSEPSKSSCRTP